MDGKVTPSFFYKDTELNNAKSLVLYDSTSPLKVETTYKITYNKFTISTDEAGTLILAEENPTGSLTVEARAELLSYNGSDVPALVFAPLTSGITLTAYEGATAGDGDTISRYKKLYTEVDSDPAKKSLYFSLDIDKIEELDDTDTVVSEIGSYRASKNTGTVEFDKTLIREVSDLKAIEYDLAGSYVIASNITDISIVLDADWKSIGSILKTPSAPFTGSLDGVDADTVKTITVTDDGNAPSRGYEWNGLFYQLDNGTLSNLLLQHDKDLITNNDTGGTAGFLVNSFNSGTVTNVEVKSINGATYRKNDKATTYNSEGILGEIAAGTAPVVSSTQFNYYEPSLGLAFESGKIRDIFFYEVAEASPVAPDLPDSEHTARNLLLTSEELELGKDYEVTFTEFVAATDASYTIKIKEINSANSITRNNLQAISYGTDNPQKTGIYLTPLTSDETSTGLLQAYRDLSDGATVYFKAKVTLATVASGENPSVVYFADKVIEWTATRDTSINNVLEFEDVRHDLAADYTLKSAIEIELTEDWSSIGSNTVGNAFQGSFDGGGNTITLSSDGNEPAGGYNWSGLFGALGEYSTTTPVAAAIGGTIKNLTIDVKTDLQSYTDASANGILLGFLQSGTITDVNVTSSASTTPTYKINKSGSSITQPSGGLVGMVGKTVSAVDPIALNNITVKNINIDASVEAVGGIVGWIHVFSNPGPEITGLEFNGSVYSSEGMVGGLVGRLFSSSASPLKISGKVGNESNTYISGAIFIGGAVGHFSTSVLSAQVDDSSSTGVIKIEGKKYVGGMVGYATNSTAKGYVNFKHSKYSSLTKDSNGKVPDPASPQLGAIGANDLGGIVFNSNLTQTLSGSIGGIVGAASVNVKVYAYANVLIYAGAATEVGGLAGRVEKTATFQASSTIVGYASGTIIGDTASRKLAGLIGYTNLSNDSIYGYVKDMYVINTGTSATTAETLALFSTRDIFANAQVFILTPSKLIGNGTEDTSKLVSSGGLRASSKVNYYATAPTYTKESVASLKLGTDTYSFTFGTDPGEWEFKDANNPPILAGGEDIYGSQ